MNTLLLSILLLGAAPQESQVRHPAKPEDRQFIVDEAKVVSSDHASEIRILADEVLTKKKTPIIVVTIPSLASVGAKAMTIDAYASTLMYDWGIGWADWNYGMLLLVSVGDRKARIEMGAAWAHGKDAEAKRVLSERVIPRFKQGDISRGILDGVRGLHDVALDAVPSLRPKPPTGQPSASPVPGVPTTIDGGGCLPVGGCGLIVIIVVGLVIVSFISRMIRRGRVTSWGPGGPGTYRGGYGYGGGMGGFGGGILGGILGSMIGNSMSRPYNTPRPPPSYGGGGSTSSSDENSSFGGGSFGGGFSGGGGATGEW